MESEEPNEPNKVDHDTLAKRLQDLPSSYGQQDKGADDTTAREAHPSRSRGFLFKASKGPIPEPENLERYDALVPGFADKYLNLFLQELSKEAEHRRELESRALRLDEDGLRVEEKIIARNQRRSEWGLLVGTVITIAALAGGIWLVSIGKNYGAAIAGSTLPSLAAVFVVGTLWKGQKGKSEGSSALLNKQPGKDSKEWKF